MQHDSVVGGGSAEPLQERTAVRRLRLMARRIWACLPQSGVLRSCRTNSTGRSKRSWGGILGGRGGGWGASGMFFRLEWVPVRLPVVLVGWFLGFRLLWVGGFGQGAGGGRSLIYIFNMTPP